MALKEYFKFKMPKPILFKNDGEPVSENPIQNAISLLPKEVIPHKILKNNQNKKFKSKMIKNLENY